MVYPQPVPSDFQIQMNHLFLARRPDLVKVSKKEKKEKKRETAEFTVLADPRVKLKESEKKDKYFARDLKK